MLRRKKIIKLDRSVEFPPRDGKICGEQGVFIKNFEEYIFVPDKTNNSGFDMTIFEKVGGGHIALNIECRFFYPERSTTLKSKDIREKYNLMKDKYRYHVKQEKNQNVTRKQRKDSKVELDNKNIIIVGKDSLEKAYTPTLVTRPQFYDNMLQGRDKISQEVMERVNERYRSS
ncbi:hypothetical protein RirG_178450 [Rhizophagus irregularis DAOM 197198w]|uniref:Uncharacterized protein n=1 Tax=Rhizophagus irregularis (strain DAOM 197198w) TaxID=1432141 RepID=A0A015ITP1_RHIIW|nr:hypothetical protein RirG_178450 [Rhizophagus irregularis DAOM 197198w]